jgi:hypothetical protein
MTPYHAAKCIIACIVAALCWWGVTLLNMPPVYRMVRAHNAILLYQGYVLLGSAVLLAWFHDLAAHKMVWLGARLHRWVAALVMVCVLWAEGTMHLINVPHLEGWWMPILGSGVCTGVLAYLTKWWKKPCDLTTH